MIRTLFAAALLLAASASAAAAQSAADTTALVRAVVARIGAPSAKHAPHFFLGEPTTDFDRWVTLRLEETLRVPLLDAAADTADWIVTRGADFSGDTAAVLVEIGTTRRPSDGIESCIETNRYFFARTPTGWEFVRVKNVGQRAMGMVRG